MELSVLAGKALQIGQYLCICGDRPEYEKLENRRSKIELVASQRVADQETSGIDVPEVCPNK